MLKTCDELGDSVRLSGRRLRQMNQKAPDERKFLLLDEVTGKYDLSFFIERYIEYQIWKRTGTDLKQEQAEHEAVKKQLSMLKLAKARGELVSTQLVVSAWQRVIEICKTRMLGIASKLGPRMVMIEEPEVIEAAIDTEIRTALEELAGVTVADYSEVEGNEGSIEGWSDNMPGDAELSTAEETDSKPMGG